MPSPTRRQVLGGGTTALLSSFAGCGLVTDRLQWSANIGETTGPVIANDTIYVGVNKPNRGRGALVSLSPANGSINWEFSTGTSVETRPAVVDGTVYGGDSDGTLYAVRNGSEQWTFTKPSDTIGTPVVAKNVVYVKASNRLHAVDRETGREEWQAELVGYDHTEPAVDSEHVYVRSNGNTYALNRSDGSEVWSAKGTGIDLTLAGNTIYIGNAADSGSGLYALNRTNGNVRWKVTDSPPITPVTDGKLLFLGSNGVFYAYDMQGQQTWRTELSEADTIGIPAHSHGSIYVVTVTEKSRWDYLQVLDANNGTKRWEKRFDHASLAAPAATNDNIYIPGSVGLYCLSTDPKLALF